jgi:hypothetical protein
VGPNTVTVVIAASACAAAIAVVGKCEKESKEERENLLLFLFFGLHYSAARIQSCVINTGNSVSKCHPNLVVCMPNSHIPNWTQTAPCHYAHHAHTPSLHKAPTTKPRLLTSSNTMCYNALYRCVCFAVYMHPRIKPWPR